MRDPLGLMRRAEASATTPNDADPLETLLAGLFPSQRAFVDDASKRRTARCSRRAGKTEGIAARLIRDGWNAPGELSVYIARSRPNARMIMGSTLERIEKRFKLGLGKNGKVVSEEDGQLMVYLPNKHRIWLAGCKDKTEVEKFRGPYYLNACIDEAQAFGEFLQTLVEDALDPALLDLDGGLMMIGTPGALPIGYFHDADTGEGEIARWSAHHWTVLDNPYIPHAAEWLEKKRSDNSWDETDGTYMREWKGLWFKDESAIIYPYNGAKNAFRSALPDGDWRYVIGVDLGDEDATAFVVTASLPGSPVVHVVKAWKQSGMNTAARAAHIEKAQKEFDTRRTVVDTGGLGKAIVRDLNETYGIYCVAAEKSEKRAAIANVKGALKSGTLQVNPFGCAALVSEWALLPWNDKRTDHHESYADDCSDALLYSYRAHNIRYRPEEVPPAPGTHEHRVAQGVAEKARVAKETMRKYRREQRELARKRRSQTG